MAWFFNGTVVYAGLIGISGAKWLPFCQKLDKIVRLLNGFHKIIAILSKLFQNGLVIRQPFEYLMPNCPDFQCLQYLNIQNLGRYCAKNLIREFVCIQNKEKKG